MGNLTWYQESIVPKFKNKTGKRELPVERIVSSVNAKNWHCIVCDCRLGIKGGYLKTGMCGPCCTGEAETITEMFKTW